MAEEDKLLQDVKEEKSDDFLIKTRKYSADTVKKAAIKVGAGSSGSRATVLARIRKALDIKASPPKKKKSPAKKKSPPKSPKKKSPKKRTPKKAEPEFDDDALIRMLAEIPPGREEEFSKTYRTIFRRATLLRLCQKLNVFPPKRCNVLLTPLFTLMAQEARKATAAPPVPPVVLECDYPEPSCPGPDTVCDLDRKMCLGIAKDKTGKKYVGTRKTIKELLDKLELQRIEEEVKEGVKVAPAAEVERRAEKAVQTQEDLAEAAQELQKARVDTKQAKQDVIAEKGTVLEKEAVINLKEAKEKEKEKEKIFNQAKKAAEKAEKEVLAISPVEKIPIELQGKGIPAVEICDPARKVYCQKDKFCDLDRGICIPQMEVGDRELIYDSLGLPYVGIREGEGIKKYRRLFEEQTAAKAKPAKKESELDIQAILEDLKTIKSTTLKGTSSMKKLQEEIDRCLYL